MPGMPGLLLDEPDPELPPELLLCVPPALLELDEEEPLDDEEPLLEDELPAEPEDPDEEDDGGEELGIDEDDCCCCSQPPIRNAPVALAAATCSASRHARLSVVRFTV